MRLKQDEVWFNLVLCLVLGLVFIALNLYPGEFLDGLTYASISRNLSQDQGTCFQLFYNDFLYPKFYEHPPFFFMFESVFFRILGDHFFVEKLVAILLFCVSTWLIFKIVKYKYEVELSPFFIAVLSLFFFTYTWIFKNNMLETMLVPLALASYWVLINRSIPWYFKSLMSAFLFLLSFFTKGPFALFIIPMYGIINLQFKSTAIIDMLKFYVLFFAGIFVAVLLAYFYQPAHLFFSTYFEVQILKSLNGEREVSSRFVYLTQLLYALLPVATIAALNVSIQKPNNLKKYYVEWLIIALYSALMLASPKQHSYYITPVIPFVVIILCGLIKPYYERVKRYLVDKLILLYAISILLLVVDIGVAYYSYTSSQTNPNSYMQISNELKRTPKKRFTFSESLSSDWKLIAVLSRFNNTQISAHATSVLRLRSETAPMPSNAAKPNIYYLDDKQPKSE